MSKPETGRLSASCNTQCMAARHMEHHLHQRCNHSAAQNLALLDVSPRVIHQRHACGHKWSCRLRRPSIYSIMTCIVMTTSMHLWPGAPGRLFTRALLRAASLMAAALSRMRPPMSFLLGQCTFGRSSFAAPSNAPTAVSGRFCIAMPPIIDCSSFSCSEASSGLSLVQPPAVSLQGQRERCSISDEGART